MNEKNGESSEQQRGAEWKPEQTAERKPYASPRLTKLGKVTELTKGGGSVIDDVGGTKEGSL